MILLDSLTPSARLAYPAVRGGVRRGLSMAAIGDLVRSHGIKIANDSLRELIRAERDIVASGPRLQFLNRNARPDASRLLESLTQIQRQYSFTVRVTGSSLTSGASSTQYVTISTDSLLTRGELEDMAENAVTGGGERYGMSVSSSQLESGVKAGSAGVL